MSAIMSKTTDPHVYVTVQQRPDGRITGISLGNEIPDREDTWIANPRTTVWAAPLPAERDEDGNVTTAKVLDLAISPHYRFGNGLEWSNGERERHAFEADKTNERAFLRTVEAHLLRAGYLDVSTGMVGCQHYGLSLPSGESFTAYQAHDGWYMAFEDVCSTDGRYEYPDPIAPRGASARRVASAILAMLLDVGGFELDNTPLLDRARIRYSLWRLTPNWANFKYRTRQRIAAYRYRINRYRRRITVRTR
ncbi:hypothetical protein EF903_05475 [Streptomyces sp. WAC05292]|uniref:hypothetical protein n=1 Tax=Streptomyces sp. WAC05292 TaxID=2487418 RepID=UPI000F745542|nr:hypothetical protein [Streptomyces sp. WAC05292]RSS95091.1 hypothetical protein EF903_05475 [Streptomyces sp. WAC05292]